MKALELKVFPRDKWGGYEVPLSVWSKFPDDDPDGFYSVHISADDAVRHSESKRFTDAELAAEHHRAKWTGLIHEHKWHSILSDEHRAMIATVERFATLPHYDEVTA